MTKMDYVLIAGVIRDANLSVSQRAALTLDMEVALSPLNENWNSRRGMRRVDSHPPKGWSSRSS